MTLAEIFTKAVMNTILGMGVVFSVLIFISFIISLFKYLPGLLEQRVAQKTGFEAIKNEERGPKPTQESSERIDSILVAVITAAVCSCVSQETDATDSYVVRSIRRS